jgi:hypothetical protein
MNFLNSLICPHRPILGWHNRSVIGSGRSSMAQERSGRAPEIWGRDGDRQSPQDWLCGKRSAGISTATRRHQAAARRRKRSNFLEKKGSKPTSALQSARYMKRLTEANPENPKNRLLRHRKSFIMTTRAKTGQIKRLKSTYVDSAGYLTPDPGPVERGTTTIREIVVSITRWYTCPRRSVTV